MDYNTLGVETTLAILGGKWKAILICILMTGPKKTSELERLIPKITQKMLIQQLRELENDGLVERIDYHQMPRKVEYLLTDYGKTANDIIQVMCTWGNKNILLRQSIDTEKASN